MNYNKDSKKYSFFKSVTFLSWASFLLLAILIITVMFGAFSLVYNVTYMREKVNEVTLSAKTVINEFPKDSENRPAMEHFIRVVDENVALHNLSVTAFVIVNGKTQENAKSEDVEVVFYSGYVEEAGVVPIIDAEFLSRLNKSGDEGFSYSQRKEEYEGLKVIVGDRVQTDVGVVYFRIESFVISADVSRVLFDRVFVWMALFAFGVSIIYAFFVTKLIAKPLVLFTRAVKEKSDNNDYIESIEGNGFAEIDALAFSLNASVMEQRKTEEFRRDLVANVSHDLRTPLTMIKAYAEMIRDLSGDNPKKRDEHCQIIINEVGTLNQLVTDLLDLSKMQAGTMEMNVEKNSLTYVTRTVLERLDIFRIRDGYEFIVDVDENCFCLCDSARIEQAIYNLICNAINYTGDDKKVFVKLKKVDGKIHFEVKDTGKGIKQEEIDNIWDKYYRAQKTKRTVVGSGIGLSIVQNVLNMHKVKFGVISKENEGATFYFEFDEYKESNNTKA